MEAMIPRRNQTAASAESVSVIHIASTRMKTEPRRGRAGFPDKNQASRHMSMSALGNSCASTVYTEEKTAIIVTMEERLRSVTTSLIFCIRRASQLLLELLPERW